MSFLLIAALSVLTARDGVSFDILRDGRPVAVGVRPLFQTEMPAGVRTSSSVAADGAKVWNVWSDADDGRFRFEVVERPDGAVELSMVGSGDARARKYEEWVGAQLDDAKRNAGGRLILATHIPPFVSLNVEPDSYENYPLAGRAARLERYIDAGAKFYLAGHTHTMLQRGWKGMAMLNAENTCMNFDERPFGFRLLTVRPDASFTWEFQAI